MAFVEWMDAEEVGTVMRPRDGGWWGLGMMLLSFLFIALIVVVVLVLVRPFSERGETARRPEGNRALDILDELFARGEVDQKG
jgi:uncharacterized membrane protein